MASEEAENGRTDIPIPSLIVAPTLVTFPLTTSGKKF
jgi:hypothetical protein